MNDDIHYPAHRGATQRRNLRGTLAALAMSAALFLSAVGQSLAAEDSKGTDFWLMFNDNLNAVTLNLFITGDVATTGNVSIPGLAFSQNFNVIPGTVTTVPIPIGAEVVTLDTVGDQGIHVTADDEVTVYGLNQAGATTDAFLGLPTDILGTDYINLGYRNVNIVNATQFGIVATQANTTVTITPTVNAGARLAGVPYNIVMNQGQTYQLRSTLASPADLSGSLITSDKPIAVFGSHQCANIPQGFVACDHIVEQLPPTTTWGQSFVTMPLATRLRGDTFRVLAGTDNTSVSINGVVVANLDRGQLHEQLIVGPATITATNPVLVAQYSNGTTFDGVTSDPFMMLIPPFEQFLADYTVTTPATVFQINYINVVAPNAAVGTIDLDGVPIPPASFTAIGASGFSGAQLPVAVGSHNLVGALPFGAFMYGFASADSYGYPGGMSLSEVATVTDLVLTPATATNPVGTEHCVDGLVTDQDGNPVPGVRVDFAISGANPGAGFANADADGLAEFCYTGTNVGMDTIVGSVGNLTDTVTKQWTPGVLICSVDTDSDIDKLDLSLISRARGQTAQPGDPRDANFDGLISPADVKVCIPLCTRPNCATQ